MITYGIDNVSGKARTYSSKKRKIHAKEPSLITTAALSEENAAVVCVFALDRSNI